MVNYYLQRQYRRHCKAIQHISSSSSTPTSKSSTPVIRIKKKRLVTVVPVVLSSFPTMLL